MPHDSAVQSVAAPRMLAAIFFLSISIWLGTGLFGRPLGEVESFLPPPSDIGSGASAQAILHYVTEYVTKQLLNSFGSYSTIQAAINRLRNGTWANDNVLSNFKRLIIRCANALVSKQELSGQQVASFLMGYGDHYTSHTFRSLYWKMFEQHFEENCSIGRYWSLP